MLTTERSSMPAIRPAKPIRNGTTIRKGAGRNKGKAEFCAKIARAATPNSASSSKASSARPF